MDSNLYSTTWFLDIITDSNWSALIYGEYEVAIPVLVKRKFFIPYITQAFLCKQIIVLSKHKPVFEDVLDLFHTYLKKNYIRVSLSFSEPLFPKDKPVIKFNHVLNLDTSYDLISANYNRNTKRNISFAKSQNIIFNEAIENSDFLNFMVDHDRTNLIKEHKVKILNLLNHTKKEKKSYMICGSDDLGMHSVAYFIIEGQTVYFLLCASNERGLDQKSMYLLIDLAIQKFAGKYKTLDFTGSNIKNISRRNEGFGANAQDYFLYNFKKW